MASSRRRTRSGLPIAVIVAVLTAVFATLANRDRGPQQSAARPQAAAAPSAATARDEARGTAAAAGRLPSRDPAPSRRDSKGFASRQRLTEHFEKHGAEFPGYTLEQYLGAAQQLRDAPVSSTVLELRRRDGVVTRFDRASGAFLAASRDSTIRTFFRPNDGEAYFRRQASRTPGGGA